MKSEKEKMLAGEAYLASDPQLQQERFACRQRQQVFNQSLVTTPEWKAALNQLLPNMKSGYIEPPFYCDYGINTHIGHHFYANFNCTILDVNRVVIGDNVMFAPNVQLYTAGHPLDVVSRIEQAIEFGLPIHIGDNVWLGGGVIVCPGVSIGDNTVIGAGSVVTKDIPANVLAVGNPCRVIRTINQTLTESEKAALLMDPK